MNKKVSANNAAVRKAHDLAMNVVRSGGSDTFPDPGEAVDRISKAILEAMNQTYEEAAKIAQDWKVSGYPDNFDIAATIRARLEK